LADVSEPLVPSNEEKIKKFNFPSVYSGINGRKRISLIETELILPNDLFVHLAELDVQKHQPSFPYWIQGISLYVVTGVCKKQCKIVHKKRNIF